MSNVGIVEKNGSKCIQILPEANYIVKLYDIA